MLLFPIQHCKPKPTLDGFFLFLFCLLSRSELHCLKGEKKHQSRESGIFNDNVVENEFEMFAIR